MVDTDVFSLAFVRSGKFEDYKPFLDQTLAAGRALLLSFASVGELLAWTYKTNWDATRKANLELAMSAYVVLPYDSEVARQYAPPTRVSAINSRSTAVTTCGPQLVP
jgi:predicted nucleic acid-binding protein